MNEITFTKSLEKIGCKHIIQHKEYYYHGNFIWIFMERMTCDLSNLTKGK
jgi:hypothetical protein